MASIESVVERELAAFLLPRDGVVDPLAPTFDVAFATVDRRIIEEPEQ